MSGAGERHSLVRTPRVGEVPGQESSLSSMNLPPGLSVGLYGRKSAKDDAGTEAESILVQYERGERWATREGHEVTQRWADNLSAWSGKERPEFMNALAALERGDVDVLWVYGSDRFTRQGAQRILNIMDRPPATRPKIYFDYESLCTWEEAHRFPLVVKAEVDRQFADRLSKNIRDTKTRQRAAGVWSTQPPYGTRRSATHPGNLEPNPDTWPTVMRIYRLSAAGQSLRGIAMALNGEHIPSPAGRMWSNATLRNILRNPMYEGWHSRKERGVPVLHLDKNGKRVRVFAPDANPLDPELVRQARAVTRGPQYPQNDVGNFAPLRGVLYCHGCGSRMQQSGGPSNRHYRCGAWANGGTCPEPATVQTQAIERYVRTAWADFASALEPADEADHAVLATMGARWYSAMTPAAETQAAREAVALARKRLERLRGDRELGLWDDDPSGFASRVRDAQGALRDAESVAVPETRLPDFAGLDADELLLLVADDVPAPERAALYSSALDAVVVCRAGRRGERWHDGRAIAVVHVSAAPRTVDQP